MFQSWRIVGPVVLALVASVASAQSTTHSREWWKRENARRAQETSRLRETWNRRKATSGDERYHDKAWWQRENQRRVSEKNRLNRERNRRKRRQEAQERAMRARGVPKATIERLHDRFWNIEEPRRRQREDARLREIWEQRKANH
ncbi:hypothetical protein EON82_03200 [bacterium]|nr:MAG: hypothetical protein EON82_03200 [bacterium]